MVARPSLADQEKFWQAQSLDAPPLLAEILDFDRPPAPSYLRSKQTHTLDPALTAGLRRFCQQQNITHFDLLLGGLAALLQRYTGQTRLVVGTLSPDSQERDGRSFVNPVPLPLDLTNRPTAADLLARAAESVAAAATHRDLPFERLVDLALNAPPLDHHPIFQVMLLLRAEPALGDAPLTAADIAAAGEATAACDWLLTVDPAAAGWRVTCEFDAQLFEEVTIARMLGHLEVLLREMSARPAEAVAALPLLTAAEQQQILIDWNDTRADYPREAAIAPLFEAQAAAAPQAIAVEFEGQSLTYADLNRRANRLAHYLQARGVGPETLVALFVERSPEMIVGLLGILKAGGAYVPLDTAYPPERLRLMLSDTRAPVILTQQALQDSLPPHQAEVICLDAAWPAIARERDDNPPPAAAADNLVYVMYTSGSTGRPKGIEIPQRGVVRLVKGANFARLTANQIFLQLAPIAFDASTLEIWGALLNGAKLVIPPPRQLSLQALATLIDTHGITILWLTAGLFHQMVEAHPDSLKRVRQLLAGGDVLQAPHVQKMLSLMEDGVLINGYGPTENTTFTCCYPMRDPARIGPSVPIGRPISNTQVYLLNEALQPVPVGVSGELYIGGDGLARGYLNQPALTAERFIPVSDLRFTIADFGLETPVHNSQLYRSGDLARWRPDGVIEFLGRRDQQLKIRGFRVELGEIETVLADHPAIGEAVVQPQPTASGQPYLAAYLTLAAASTGHVSFGQRPDDLRRDLRRYLQGYLPDYMIPAAFVFLDALPLNPNGKVDRAALPAPDLSRPELAEDYQPPRTPLEQTLAEVWGEVLGFERIGLHDNFFALGGHSLLATQVVSRIQKLFRLSLPLQTIFEAPTIAQLTETLARYELQPGQAAAPADSIPAHAADRPAPLSFAQQRLWFLDQLEPGNPAYNIPTAFIRLTGRLDAAALEQSLREIIRRHQSLRTTFPLLDGQPRQQVNPPALELPLIDLQPLPPVERQAEADRLAAEEARRPFDLARGPLLRCQLLRLSANEHALLVTAHHIVSDGWSLSLFYRELAALYRAFVAGRPSPLPDLPVQYPAFSDWQRERAAQGDFEADLAYWRQQLADAPPVLPLPLDHPRPVLPGRHPSRRRLFRLSPELSAGLQRLSRDQGVTLFMTLLAAFYALLFRYTRQTDLNIGTNLAGRRRADLEPLIGIFVNTLVLRADLSGGPTFRDLLQQVRQTALDAYAHQDLPFEMMVEALQPARDFSLTPFFQVMFVLQNAPSPPLDLPGLTLAVHEVDSGAAKFDLELELVEQPTGLFGSFEYDAALFEPDTIERLVGHWQTLLAGIVANPAAPIAALPLLTEAERHQLLVEFNQTARAFPLADCFPQRFERQVAQTPDAIAVTCEGVSLTYEQLNAQANRLAHWLAGQGVGPETVVALLAERGLEFLTMILAVFKAGGAYLPLDPLHPPLRHRQIVQQSRTPLVLASAEFLPGLTETLADIPVSDRPPVAAIEPLLADSTGPADNLPPRAAPSNLAYVIYTSGSTGTPKGAMVTHVGMLNHLWSKIEDLAITAADRLAQNASQCFDISVWQFLAALLVGGQVHIFKNEIAHDPPRLLAEVSRQRITIFQLVPSLLRAIIQATTAADTPPPDLAALRWVVPTGEALTTELARHWLTRYPDIPLLNAYGSTECSDDQCHHPLRVAPPPDFHLPTIPIGKAMANVQMYILDAALNPVPIGVPGELYVGGIGVGRGYLHDPVRTAAAFIPNPFAAVESEAEIHNSQFTIQNSKLYKTGDLGRYLPDGTIEFLGRVDFMVKMRGFRIELGEIEAALAAHPNVREAVVLARSPADAPEEKYLAAYVVPQHAPAPNVDNLRDHLQTRLPDYMLPAAFVALESMPLNNNGKIDRRALPEPELDRAALGGEFQPPATPVERVLAGLWAEVLKLPQVGATDDFFALGGHSLLATQLIFKVREAFQVELPLRDFFRAPTVAGLARTIEALRRGQLPAAGEGINFKAEARLPADIQPAAGDIPATEPAAIFLTGATGFLGAFLLAELLRQTSAAVYCLVRADDEAAGRARLRDSLQQYGLWDESQAARLVPVIGDLAAPQLGLPAAEFAALAERVDAIYHNGALVNFVYPYRRLKPANVGGTLEVLRLAAQRQTISLHYISTTSVFDARGYFTGARQTIFEADAPAHSEGLMYGYAQSKWVAERLALAARARGLPVSIYRPGTVTGDSTSGAWNEGDYLSRLLKGCLQLGSVPALTQHLRMAPVDFVSRAIVTLSRRRELLGQTFHVLGPGEMSLAALAEHLRAAGYPLAELPYAAWQRRLIEAGPANALYALLPLFVERVLPDEERTLIELLAHEPHFDTRQLQAGLAGSGVECPPVDGALLAKYLRHFQVRGFLPPPT